MLRNIFWKIGVLGDYRKVFWKFALPRLRHGDIEGLIAVAHDRASSDHVRARGLGRPAERLELFDPAARGLGPCRVTAHENAGAAAPFARGICAASPRRASGLAAPAPACRPRRCSTSRSTTPAPATRFMPPSMCDARFGPRASSVLRRSASPAAPATARTISGVPTSDDGSIRIRGICWRSTRAVPCRLAIVVGDGLSPSAVNAHAVELVRSLIPQLAADGIEIGRAVVATRRAGRARRRDRRHPRCAHDRHADRRAARACPRPTVSGRI